MPSFPTVTVLDSFKRENENPLSNGGKWKAFFPASTHLGKITAEHWETVSGGIVEGAYWQPIEFTSPGVALQWTSSTEQETYWRLWACVSNPTSGELDGYALKLKQEGAGKFEVKLEKCVANVLTELAKTTGVAFAVGDRFGLSVQKGKVIGWRKKGVGAWEELLSKADGTYTKGFVAFDARAADGDLVNFEAGIEEEEGPPPPPLENPGTQHTRVLKPVSLQIKAAVATLYAATNLPAGLSINSETGLITGEPTTVESVLVKLNVENGEEKFEAVFEWTISESGNDITDMLVG
jgi:hypothetical protein